MRSLSLAVLLPLCSLAGEPLPAGWFLADPRGDFASTPLDGRCGDARAVALESRAPGAGNATVMQLFKAEAFAGKRVRFSANVSTALRRGWAGLWMRVDAATPGQSFAFDNMQDRPLTGSMACARPEVVLDVPASAVTVAAGAVLDGDGRLELSGVRFEVVPPDVASTNLLGKGLALGPPGASPELLPNELTSATGRVGAIWFNDLGVQGCPPYLACPPEATVLHQRNPGRWSNATNDSLVTLDGDRLDIKLASLAGQFHFRREGEELVITGRWGGRLKFPVTIRMGPQALDMAWGSVGVERFYVRHLVREDAPQVDPACVRFVEYGSRFARVDQLYVCGQVLKPDAPPVQTTVAFLLAGFRKSSSGTPSSHETRDLLPQERR